MPVLSTGVASQCDATPTKTICQTTQTKQHQRTTEKEIQQSFLAFMLLQVVAIVDYIGFRSDYMCREP